MSRNLKEMALIMTATAAYEQYGVFELPVLDLVHQMATFHPTSRSVSQRRSMSSPSKV